MSVILATALAFMLAQTQTEAVPPPVIGTVPTPNAELDAAYACLVRGAARLFAEQRPAPDEQARWGWSVAVAKDCERELDAAADSKGAAAVLGDNAHSSITKRDMLRAEATYLVDRMIRQFYESKP